VCRDNACVEIICHKTLIDEGQGDNLRRLGESAARRHSVAERDIEDDAVTAMEPMLPEESSGLQDLATDLVAKASTLAGKVNPVLAASISTALGLTPSACARARAREIIEEFPLSPVRPRPARWSTARLSP
jgi:hypothetical protein